jgi:ketopantoate reductase
MNIPKKFKLMGSTFTVEYNDDMCKGAEAFGLASYDTNKIYLSTKVNNDPINQDQIEHTFLHEVVHHILHIMGKEKLNSNEKFVDMLAGFLHQLLTTSEY